MVLVGWVMGTLAKVLSYLPDRTSEFPHPSDLSGRGPIWGSKVMIRVVSRIVLIITAPGHGLRAPTTRGLDGKGGIQVGTGEGNQVGSIRAIGGHGVGT
jgi:hypothetical protein